MHCPFQTARFEHINDNSETTNSDHKNHMHCVQTWDLHQSIELASKKKEEDKPASRGHHLASDSGPRGTFGRKPEATQSNGMRTAHRLRMRPIYEFFFFFLQICFPSEDRIFSSEICSQNSEIRGNEEEFYALVHYKKKGKLLCLWRSLQPT